MAVKLIDELQKEIKAAGEAVKQEAYEKAYDHVFQILDNLEKLLNDNRYLEGNEITEEDKRLYDILIRFDAVYYFKQRLNLWAYARDLYQIPAFKNNTYFKDFANPDNKKQGRTFESFNARFLDEIDFDAYWGAPHNRARLSSDPGNKFRTEKQD